MSRKPRDIFTQEGGRSVISEALRTAWAGGFRASAGKEYVERIAPFPNTEPECGMIRIVLLKVHKNFDAGKGLVFVPIKSSVVSI